MGNAQWEFSQNAWDTGGCTCSIVDKDIEMDAGNTIIKCKKANADYYVANADKYRTKKVSDNVFYSTQRRWCAQCYPGYLPITANSPDSYGIYLRPGNGNWGVASCAAQVAIPDYAPGCTINFDLPTGDDVMADCRLPCPLGSATESDGAQSIEECIPDYSQTYEDGTGWFVLGSFETCP
jgi:hypothetical protein